MMVYESIIRFCYLLVGCLYPAFASFKILNGNHNDAKCSSNSFETQRIWLSYWIVYGIYIIIDFFSQHIETLFPLPFFKEFKLLFLCWLLPSIGGGHKLIYDEFICSFLKQNENSIDQAIGRASETGSHMLGKCLKFTFNQLSTIGESFLCSIRRNHKGKFDQLRLTPSVEVIISQILAKRQAKEKKSDLFQDVHEDPISDNNREAQKPPTPPPKPKKKESSDFAIPSFLNRTIHENQEIYNLMDIAQCSITSSNATANDENH